jgi:hypothetical protein
MHAPSAAQAGLGGLRGWLSQHVHRPPGHDIDEHGFIHRPAAQPEDIDAQDPQGGNGQVGQGADQPKQHRLAGTGRIGALKAIALAVGGEACARCVAAGEPADR